MGKNNFKIILIDKEGKKELSEDDYEYIPVPYITNEMKEVFDEMTEKIRDKNKKTEIINEINLLDQEVLKVYSSCITKL